MICGVSLRDTLRVYFNSTTYINCKFVCVGRWLLVDDSTDICHDSDSDSVLLLFSLVEVNNQSTLRILFVPS